MGRLAWETRQRINGWVNDPNMERFWIFIYRFLKKRDISSPSVIVFFFFFFVWHKFFMKKIFDLKIYFNLIQKFRNHQKKILWTCADLTIGGQVSKLKVLNSNPS